MNAPTHCPNCGNALSGLTPEGLCPRCLFGQGLEELGDVAGDPPINPTEHATRLSAVHPGDVQHFAGYELLEEIARGGMGVVFKARQISLNRAVALKLISGGALATPGLVKRFRAEAEAAASLAHPNIVPIFEIGEEQGQHYFSMGLIEGPNLREALSKGADGDGLRPNRGNAAHRRPWKPKQAARLVAIIARAVHYAHQRGVLHRDIKPSNILLEADGTPHLTDFGLAKLLQKESTLTCTNAILGTPAYMAPEQARGETKEVTTAVDVYGLGAVLYETLTGSPPFAGGTTLETIRKVLDEDPVPPTVFAAAVDSDLETICLKCLEKEAERRYGSAEALADDLDRWCRSEPIQARPVTTAGRIRKWVRRKPALATLATAFSLAVVIGVMGVLIESAKVQNAAEELRKNLYVSQVQVASLSAENGNTSHAHDFLANQIPARGQQDLRGFEWRYLWPRVQPQELVKFPTERAELWSGAFSRDGRLLIVGDSEGRLYAYDVLKREKLRVVTTASQIIDAISFSPGDRLFAINNRGSRILLFDRDRLEPTRILEGFDQSVNAVDFSPDGKWLVTAEGRTYGLGIPGKVQVWDTTTFRAITLGGVTDWLMRARFSPDGRWVAAAGGGFAKVWKTATWQEVANLEGHQPHVLGLRFSPDGEMVASADTSGLLRTWQLPSGKNLLNIAAHSRPIYSLAFSPSGKEVASCSGDHTIKLWDTANGALLNTFSGHSARIHAVEFSPDGSILASVSVDGTVRFWDPRSRPDTKTFTHHRAVSQAKVAFSPNSRWLAMSSSSSSSNEVHLETLIYDLAEARIVGKVPGHSFHFLPSGALLTQTATNQVSCWELPSLHQTRQMILKANLESFDATPSVSAPNTRIAFLMTNGRLNLFNSSTLQPDGWLPTEGKLGGFVLAARGRILFSQGRQNEVRCWDTKSGKSLAPLFGHEQPALCFALSSSEDLLASSGYDGLVVLWDTRTWKRVARLRGSIGSIWCLAFAPDGKTLAAGSHEGSVKFWNIATLQEVMTLRPHISIVVSLAFSLDGKYVASASVDDTIQLQHAPLLKELESAENRRTTFGRQGLDHAGRSKM